jgi:GPH family glycoside/pentoside/hexuronide:cation symporter
MSNTSPSDDFATTSEPDKLNLSTKLAYGAGDLGTAITANVLVFYLSFFLTNVAGMSPGLAGTVRMVAGIWDAINDPIVGVLSDRTRSRWGRRYPWMIFGAVPLGMFFFLHWLIPPFITDPGTNQLGLFWYYIFISIFFNTAFTAVNLPYTALTPELTQDYNERTSLNSFRFAFSIGGSILSLILAQIIFSTIKDQTQQYLLLGGICAIACILPTYWCVWGTRQRVRTLQAQAEEDNSASLPYFQQLRIVFNNRPFLFVIGIYLFSWLGVQVTATIIPYFVVNWMGLQSQVSAQVALAVQVTAWLMLFVWSAVSKRLGKKAVYFMGMSVWIIAQAGLFFLQPGQVGLMYVLAVMAGVGVSTAYLIPWSMMPDVIELDELRTGQRREGIFYGFMVMLQKIGLAIGLQLVGIALQWSGFQSTISGQPAPDQPASALLAIRLAIGPLPTIALICGLILAYFYPLTREVHAEILLKLRERRQQNQA